MKKLNLLLFAAVIFTFIGGANAKEGSLNISLNANNENTSVVSEIKKAKFKCKGIGCKGCINTITTAVKLLDGVKEVTAEVKTKIVKITYEPEIVSLKQIEKAINDSGYETEVIN